MLSITLSAAARANPTAVASFDRAVEAARTAAAADYPAALDKAFKAYVWLIVVETVFLAGDKAAA